MSVEGDQESTIPEYTFCDIYFKLVVFKKQETQSRTFDPPPYLPKGIQIEKPDERKGVFWLVAQWMEYGPVNQRVTSLIPSQGTCLGCGPGLR